MDFLNEYSKIKQDSSGSLVRCYFYNRQTKEVKSVIVDDLEYQYGDGLINRDFTLEQLEHLRRLPIDGDALKQYKIDGNIPFEGATVEVIKGRKYKVGSRGIITSIYDYKDVYGRFVATYCITDNGMKVNTSNVKVVG